MIDLQEEAKEELARTLRRLKTEVESKRFELIEAEARLADALDACRRGDPWSIPKIDIRQASRLSSPVSAPILAEVADLFDPQKKRPRGPEDAA